MKVYEFTPEDVLAEVIKLAEERPDFVYKAQAGSLVDEGCSYLTAGLRTLAGEGCIVGQALTRLGVSDEDLYEVEGDSAIGAVARLRGENLTEFSRTIQKLGAIQSWQDHGYSWGVAVRGNV